MKPLLKALGHVSIVVKDLDVMIKKYTDDYGVEPWTVMDLNPEIVKSQTIHEKPVEYSYRAALCNIGNVKLELIQPQDDKSLYAKFLKEHGEGVHHCAFIVDDYEKFGEKMKDKGFEVLMGGNINGLKFAYYPTHEELGVVIETYDIPKDLETNNQ